MPIADNYTFWEQNEFRQEEALRKMPVCEYCGEHIQDEYAYCIEGTWICEKCMNEHFRREVLPE